MNKSTQTDQTNFDTQFIEAVIKSFDDYTKLCIANHTEPQVPIVSATYHTSLKSYFNYLWFNIKSYLFPKWYKKYQKEHEIKAEDLYIIKRCGRKE